PPQWRALPPFYDHLDLKLEALADGRSVIRLPFQRHFGNTRGEMHGGMVAGLADITMSQAVRSRLDRDADVATISLTLNYLAPARGELTCEGVAVGGGRSVAFAEAEVIDESGRSVCRASAVYRLLAKRN
ncbi:MAG: PaaI family thioesterase, partial [Burkholderiales bacterium]|nr:PaaI family thioesterase [Burkholderiales bacterium]